MGSNVSRASKTIENGNALTALLNTTQAANMDEKMDVKIAAKTMTTHSGSAPPSQPTYEAVQQQRVVASSPAPGAKDLKRPLSPFSAAIADAQAPKRARGEVQGPTCLHCGCESHRWTACMSRCDHCGARHMGKRCPQLDLNAYKPGGFLQNKHYRPPVSDMPPLPLTPVDAAMPDYTTTRDEHNSYSVSALPQSVETAGHQRADAGGTVAPSVKNESIDPGCDDSKMPSSAVPAYGGSTGVTFATGARASTADTPAVPRAWPGIALDGGTGSARSGSAAGRTKPSTASSQPVGSQTPANGDSKMDAGRAALIALTPATDLPPSSTPKRIEGGGPRLSGENNTPLGRSKPIAFGVPSKLGSGVQQAIGMGSQTRLNTTASTVAAPVDGRAGSIASSMHNGASVNADRAVAKAHRATANMQKALDDARKTAFLGPRSFGSQNIPTQGPTSHSSSDAPRGTVNSLGAPTAASPIFSFTMSTNGKTSTKVAQPKAPQKDLQTWRTVEGQIKAAVESTKRAGKCCNGKNKRVEDNANVNYAMDILRHVILGGPHVDMNMTPGPEPPGPPAANMSMPQPCYAHSAPLAGPQGPSPPPPPGMMVWDWPSGSWRWQWQ